MEHAQAVDGIMLETMTPLGERVFTYSSVIPDDPENTLTIGRVFLALKVCSPTLGEHLEHVLPQMAVAEGTEPTEFPVLIPEDTDAFDVIVWNIKLDLFTGDLIEKRPGHVESLTFADMYPGGHSGMLKNKNLVREHVRRQG